MMPGSRVTMIGLLVVAHHGLALYSISAERFSLPLANFSSTILFPAVLIVNALPLALAGAIGAMVDAIFANASLTKILFLSAFIVGSTVQWVLIGWLISWLIIGSEKTK